MFQLIRKSSLPVIVLLMLIFLVAITIDWTVHASPVESTYLSVTPSVYVAEALGEAFTININVSNVQKLQVFEFKLGYNTTLLDAVEVIQGPFFPPPPKASIEKLEINETVGLIGVRISLSGSEPPMNGSGTLATITFNVTFAPTPPEKACCVLDLHDTLLYDNSMTIISHDSANGLYFWKSIQADPPVDGRLLDLSTQKDGIGQGVPGGTFTLGEIVELTANLTYNGNPVQGKLASFAVMNPKNETVLVQVAITDSEGFAAIDFRIPPTPASLGTWTAIAAAEVACEVVWDFLTFEVTYAVPPHGPEANFTEIPERPYVNEIVEFDASTSLPGWNGTHEMPIVEYLWDFGDGENTTVSVPIVYHRYASPGVYIVVLTVYAPGAYPETDNVTHSKVVSGVPPVVGGHIFLFKDTSASTDQPIPQMLPISVIASVTTILVTFCRTRINNCLPVRWILNKLNLAKVTFASYLRDKKER